MQQIIKSVSFYSQILFTKIPYRSGLFIVLVIVVYKKNSKKQILFHFLHLITDEPFFHSNKIQKYKYLLFNCCDATFGPLCDALRWEKVIELLKRNQVPLWFLRPWEKKCFSLKKITSYLPSHLPFIFKWK